VILDLQIARQFRKLRGKPSVPPWVEPTTRYFKAGKPFHQLRQGPYDHVLSLRRWMRPMVRITGPFRTVRARRLRARDRARPDARD